MIKPVFCLMGPTASGKTALGLELVQQFPFEIISVDSAMIYRDMNIGTAKPSEEELAIAPHYLINRIDPPDVFSVAQFCNEAKAHIEDIHQRNHYPLLLGGTMMYFHALQQGLANLPEANPELRETLGQYDSTRLYEALKQKDPKAAERINPHDRQRLQRALEIIYLTGENLTVALNKAKEKSPYSFITMQLLPVERSILHEKIAERFHQMLALGFVAEVEAILSKWQPSPETPSMRSVGYRQALSYLAGTMNYETFVDKAIIASRQLAKRQLTWLRHWESQVDVSGKARDIFEFVLRFFGE